MKKPAKKQSNAFSTGGGGAHFEAHIQASFVALMLSGGYAPALPCWPIKKIKLQGKIDGYDTDDLIVSVTQKGGQETKKLLCQIKYSIKITKQDENFKGVIQSAWNDFNNPHIFKQGKDVIALITSHLTSTDTTNILWILEHARKTTDVNEFNLHVARANFSPPKCQEKLDVIKHHLQSANSGIDIADEQLYSFLRHFYILGYDLGSDSGVSLSLLQSHISQFNHQEPEHLWSYIVDIVQTWNQNAGTITIDNLPRNLIEAFRKPTAAAKILTDLVTIKSEPKETDWNQHPNATDFALASLIGSWNDKNSSDIEILSKITNQGYGIFTPKVREALVLPDKPFKHKNGIWNMPKRLDTWHKISTRLFDDDLERFKNVAIAVLSESDPSFDLPSDKRYFASIYGKTWTYSNPLRRGIAEGLAILRNHQSRLCNCSTNKADQICDEIVYALLYEADWIRWGSLNDLLPLLAEAAPDTFLKVIEKSISTELCPFDALFQQEDSGTFGGNYLAGLWWALEGLAWDEEYLVQVCVMLSELAERDPSDNWGNDPLSSLSTILLPWFPQTTASAEKQKTAIRIVIREQPTVGWKLLLSLLPKPHQMSFGSHKPMWRKSIPGDWEKSITREEYWEIVSFYSELAVTTAKDDLDKISKLIDNFGHLTKPACDNFLGFLNSKDVQQLPETQRLALWKRLTKFTGRHRKRAGKEGALKDDILIPIEAVAKSLVPQNPFIIHQHLFTHNDFELYEGNEGWETRQKILDERRKDAVQEILTLSGLDTIIRFASIVKAPKQVGLALATISTPEIDGMLIPNFLLSEESKSNHFISCYICRRHHDAGWNWADSIEKSEWNNHQIAQFLSYLPFEKETWDKAEKWLGDSVDIYWKTVPANLYNTDENLELAVEQLLKYERPVAAIDCLSWMKYKQQPINVKYIVRALLGAISSEENEDTSSTNDKLELIQVLQNSPDITDDDLFRVEWAYLRLLDGHCSSVRPKYLTNKLASDPAFFCEVIQLAFGSKHEDKKHRKSLTKDQQIIATQAWHLLREWTVLPGENNAGEFSPEQFQCWLDKVIFITTESGHLEIALSTIGQVLIYSPSDNDGLWIHHTIAETINRKEMEYMREGYQRATYNARGVYRIDPSGKPELELADKYRKKADIIENAGYQRLAETLREISDYYIRNSRTVIEDYRRDTEEDHYNSN